MMCAQPHKTRTSTAINFNEKPTFFLMQINDEWSCLLIVHSFCLSLLGDSGGVVNSLDFCPASLKSVPWLLLLPVCTFFTVEGGDSEFANFTLPTLKAFLEARSHNVNDNTQ